MDRRLAPGTLTALEAISRSRPDWRAREGQIQMMEAIDAGLQALPVVGSPKTEQEQGGGQIIVIEAGTGTGKSLGYLLPVIARARQTGHKVVISTGTIQLQEQLLNRDLPDLQANTDLGFTFALAKGRGHYVCPSKLRKAAQQGRLLPDPTGAHSKELPPDTARALFDQFQAGTWSGDRGALQDALPERQWAAVTEDATGCTRRQCSDYGTCPYFKAREQIKAAQVIVANHSLVMADISLAGGGAIVPAPEQAIYIFDEAHKLEHTAAESMSRKLSLDRLSTWAEQAGAQAQESYQDYLHAYGDQIHWTQADQHDLQERISRVAAASLALRNQLFEDAKIPGRGEERERRRRWRNGELPPATLALTRTLAETLERGALLAEDLKARIEQAVPESQRGLSPHREQLEQITRLARHLRDAQKSTVALMAERGRVPPARWYEVHTRDKQSEVSVYAAPVDVSWALHRQIWSRTAATVLTSATLTALGSFDKFARDTGIALSRSPDFVKVPSPFNYQQGEIVVAGMQHLPDKKDNQAYLEEMAARIPRDLIPGVGNLLLFASRDHMRQVLEMLPEQTRAITLAQGSASKAWLLAEHARRVAAGQTSLLMGLDSMAEGLDLPGVLCRQVMIARIPFSPPNTPIMEARADWLRSQNVSIFDEIMVPEASLKLIQAVGRLIRREEDSGRVMIYDRRMALKPYGHRLLSHLPPMVRTIEPAPVAPEVNPDPSPSPSPERESPPAPA